MNVPTGDQPFLHIHEGALYIFVWCFDCYVIFGLFVGVIALLYQKLARTLISGAKLQFFSRYEMLYPMFYDILSKNVSICIFAMQKNVFTMNIKHRFSKKTIGLFANSKIYQ